MSALNRCLPLPATWTTVDGLWIAEGGLFGTVFDERTRRVILFEDVRIVSADATGWTVRDVIACLQHYDTPRNVEPQISYLTEAELEPLVACGALTAIDRLRLLSHVPGWQP